MRIPIQEIGVLTCIHLFQVPAWTGSAFMPALSSKGEWEMATHTIHQVGEGIHHGHRLQLDGDYERHRRRRWSRRRRLLRLRLGWSAEPIVEGECASRLRRCAGAWGFSGGRAEVRRCVRSAATANMVPCTGTCRGCGPTSAVARQRSTTIERAEVGRELDRRGRQRPRSKSACAGRCRREIFELVISRAGRADGGGR